MKPRSSSGEGTPSLLNCQRRVRISPLQLGRFLGRVSRTVGARPDAFAVCLLSDAAMARLNWRYRGKRGHPVALPAFLRDKIREAKPGATLHDVIHAHADMRVDVDVQDRGITRDVDRKEDLGPP